MIYRKEQKRFNIFLVISKSVMDLGIFYEYKPPFGAREIKHQIRIGLIFIRFYISIF